MIFSNKRSSSQEGGGNTLGYSEKIGGRRGEGAGDCEGYVIFLIFQNITMLLTRGERGGSDRDGC